MDINFFLDNGYLGLFIAALLAGTMVPFNSEIVLVTLLVLGLDPWKLIFFASAGNVLGGFTTYAIGRSIAAHRIQKWFRLSPGQLHKWEKKGEKWGYYLALLSWIPLAGNAILLSLGALKSPALSTTSFMAIGKIIRYIILTALAGYISDISPIFAF